MKKPMFSIILPIRWLRARGGPEGSAIGHLVMDDASFPLFTYTLCSVGKKKWKKMHGIVQLCHLRSFYHFFVEDNHTISNGRP